MSRVTFSKLVKGQNERCIEPLFFSCVEKSWIPVDTPMQLFNIFSTYETVKLNGALRDAFAFKVDMSH